MTLGQPDGDMDDCLNEGCCLIMAQRVGSRQTRPVAPKFPAWCSFLFHVVSCFCLACVWCSSTDSRHRRRCLARGGALLPPPPPVEPPASRRTRRGPTAPYSVFMARRVFFFWLFSFIDLENCRLAASFSSSPFSFFLHEEHHHMDSCPFHSTTCLRS